jgi:hypothetical protein
MKPNSIPQKLPICEALRQGGGDDLRECGQFCHALAWQSRTPAPTLDLPHVTRPQSITPVNLRFPSVAALLTV